MAVRAVQARARETTTVTAPHGAVPRPAATAPAGSVVLVEQLAPIRPIRPVSRVEALAAARRERRRWLVISAVFFVTPFVACVGVLEVVR